MSQPLQLIDVSTWTGNWPFVPLAYRDYSRLKEKLVAAGVRKAFLAPIEAILEQDPQRANRQLLQDIAGDSFYSPVPVIDLSYANWRETVELAAADGRVRLIKLIPNYHQYTLESQLLEPLVAYAKQHNWTIGVQIRVEDMRSQHRLMKVPDVDVVQAAQVAAHFPEQPFIFHNMYMAELTETLRARARIYADTSSLEQVDLLLALQSQHSLDRFLFASHAPFYFVEGNTFKYRFTDAPEAEVHRAAYSNAAELLGL